MEKLAVSTSFSVKEKCFLANLGYFHHIFSLPPLGEGVPFDDPHPFS
jgi:hypothetical protein